MPKKSNQAFKQKFLKSRKASKDYREALKLLRLKKRHSTQADVAPLVKTMLAKLKKQGFNSFREYRIANKPILDKILRDEFEKQAIPREVRLLDLTRNDYPHLIATEETLWRLRAEGVIPDTLFPRFSSIEKQICIEITRDTDVSTDLNPPEIRAADITDVRTLLTDYKPTFMSPKLPQIVLVSEGIYDKEIYWALWREIMRKTWELLGIMVDKPVRTTNDLTVGGKKITGLWPFDPNLSGSTSCLDLDFDLAERLVRPIAGRTHPKLSIKKRMTSAKIELGREVSFDEYFGVFKKVIQKILHLTFVPGELTATEKKLIARYLPRYQSERWTWEGKYNG